MNSERAQAYGRVTKLVDDLSGSKLHATEQQIIRDAADSLFFCEDLAADPEARRALDAFEQLVDSMVENERFTPETAGRLQADVEGCGPLVPAAS
ncbi:MAG TPA: hypothetical protein VF517_17610 [Thermoleophilaceae bacterium]|jgi:hypothetical protein